MELNTTESVLETLMENIERRFPNLINCFGRLNFDSDKCEKCKYAWECYRFEPTLKRDDFKPGKYREGFGRPVRSVRERK